MYCFTAPIPTSSGLYGGQIRKLPWKTISPLNPKGGKAESRWHLSAESLNAETPAGDAAEFGKELQVLMQEMSNRMNVLPSGASFPVPRRGRRKSNRKHPTRTAQTISDEEVRKIELELFGASDTNNPYQDDDDWTVEQRAIYSLVREYDPNPIPDPNAEQVEFETPSLDPQYVSQSRASQTEPRKLDANVVQQRLSSVKKRRLRLAEERGETAYERLAAKESPEKKAERHSLEILEEIDRDHIKNLFHKSASQSIIIDMNARQREQCELTAGIHQHLSNIWQSPRAYKPFLGMQEAFLRLSMPECPRCHNRYAVEQLQNISSICNSCYSQIYLEMPPGSVRGDPASVETPWVKDEIALEEERTTKETEALVRRLYDPTKGATRMSASEGESPTSAKGQVGIPSKNGVGDESSGDATGSSGSIGDGAVAWQYRGGDEWNVNASERSLRTINPIRNLIQNIQVKPNPSKELIRLSVGDPTLYGNLCVPPRAVEKFCEVIRGGEANGYSMSMGSLAAREAVAQRYSSKRSPLGPDDIFLTGGTSGALELVFGAIANEGDNILLPRPGFPLFRTIAEGYGIECRYYSVNPEKKWEIELGDISRLADENTKAIVINNPSNPCGSVYSKSHIQDLLAVASALKLPVVVDEVYADMVFPDETFTAVGDVSVDVPVLSVGGISKQFVVPGWRLGWVIAHDRAKILTKGGVRQGLKQLTTRMLVPNTPAQFVLPTLLKEGLGDLMSLLESNARFTENQLANVPGIRVLKAQGAMYLMAQVDVELLGLKDDMEFVEELLKEEAVMLLPGECFQAKNFVRIVYSAPQQVLGEACERISAFCKRRVQ